MAKLPYMQFYPADYQADVRRLAMATQGAWMQILCILWRAPKRGRLTLTLEEWGRELGCPASEVSLYLTDLKHHQVGKISHELIKNVEHITISSKRIMREKMKQTLALKRKQKQRDMSMSRACHADVTRLSQQSHAEESESDIRNQISEGREEKKEEKKEEKSRLRVVAQRSPRLTDEEFLALLRTNPAYAHIAVDTELAKMDVWLSTKPGRQKTRKFIVNWLNKIDAPVNGSSRLVSAPIPPFPGPEDPIARNLWRKSYGNPANPQRLAR